MNDNWTDNPTLNGIDKAKLDMLSSLASQGSSKSQNDLMPFLLMAANRSKEKGMQFSPDEMNLVLEVMKMGKSPEELTQIEKVINIMKMMRF